MKHLKMFEAYHFDETAQILTALFDDGEWSRSEELSCPGFDVYLYEQDPREEDVEIAKERMNEIGKNLSIRRGWCCVYDLAPGDSVIAWLKSKYGNLKVEKAGRRKEIRLYKDGDRTIMATENDWYKQEKATIWVDIETWNFLSSTLARETTEPAGKKSAKKYRTPRELDKEIELAMLTRIIPQWVDECYGLKKGVDYMTIGKSDEEDFENLEDI